MKVPYREIYDYLYQNGYHACGKNHALQFLDYIVENYDFDSVLDVGCSNGMFVKAMQEKEKSAHGVDISQVAINLSIEETKVTTCKQANAMNLPFDHDIFDIVFSCDVLEHLNKSDSFLAMQEMVRVSKKYIMCYIDGEIERNKNWINYGRQHNLKLFGKIKNLHLTVKPISFWNDRFKKIGADYVTSYNGLMIYRLR